MSVHKTYSSMREPIMRATSAPCPSVNVDIDSSESQPMIWSMSTRDLFDEESSLFEGDSPSAQFESSQPQLEWTPTHDCLEDFWEKADQASYAALCHQPREAVYGQAVNQKVEVQASIYDQRCPSSSQSTCDSADECLTEQPIAQPTLQRISTYDFFEGPDVDERSIRMSAQSSHSDWNNTQVDKSGVVSVPQGEHTAQNSTSLTTVMMRNLPNDYSRRQLLALLESRGFAGKFDFVYYPIDFRTHSAMGYAFVNMVSEKDAARLHQEFQGFQHWSVSSRKRCSVGWSKPLQGLAAHIERFRNSPLMHHSVPDDYRPALFEKGVRVAFPAPTKSIKPPRQGAQRMLV